MWVSIELADHVWQPNLADALADYLNTHKIEPKSVITLEVTEKYFSGVGWQKEQSND
jgi:sensor c-di-GMP phosphodiesterase-like protein